MCSTSMNQCCISGDMRIITENGLGRAEDLYNIGTATTISIAEQIASEQDVSIKQEASSIFKIEEDAVLKVSTDEGYSIEVTPNHQFYLDSGEWRKAKNLVEGDVVRLLDHQGLFGSHGTYEEGVLQGVLSENRSESFEDSGLTVSFDNISQASSVEITQLYEWVSAISNQSDMSLSMSSVTSSELEEVIKQSPLDRDELQGKIPDSVFTGSIKLVRGFLQSIFELRGEVKNPAEEQMYLNIYGDSSEYLKDIQLLLLNFGVKSTLSLSENEPVLRIRGNSIVTYEENIGFLSSTSYKSNRFESCFTDQEDDLLEIEEDYTATISDTEYLYEEPVYSLTEPTTESYIVNGFVSK